MAKTIEENVVKMEFDNAAFEKNVNQSISTLDKLKNTLSFKGIKEKLSTVGKDIEEKTLAPIARGVETVKVKFSILEVAVAQTLTNIVSNAVNAGTRMVKALSVDPIMDGFREYEIKMNSVQTMMMSSGESLEMVNGYLQQLNRYADKTIYSFSDMTSNIGKFTNAGVGLKDAVLAIQGISNEAALSGANANEASRAMYNLAQAISSGCVRLIDWKSIENANMATMEFKNQLIETALEVGTLRKQEDKYISTTQDLNGKISEAFTASNGFNDSLSAQWMTTDVLVQTLGKYADETTDIGKKAFEAATKVKTFTQLVDTLKEAVGSGWAESFEIMIGDFEEARDFMTEISDTIGDIISAQADRRNDFLTGAFGSGWKQLLREGVFDATAYRETVTKVAKDHGVAVDDLIEKNGSFEASLKEGWATADILTESLELLTEKYSKMSDEELRNTGFSREQVDVLKELNAKVQDGTISMQQFSDAMKIPSGRENLIAALRNSFQGMMSVIKPISEGLKDVFGALDSSKFYKLTKALSDFTSHLTLTDRESENLRKTVRGLAAVVDFFLEILKKAAIIVEPLTRLIRPTFDLVLELSGRIGDAIYKLEQSFFNSSFAVNFKENFGTVINSGIQLAKDAFTSSQNFIEGLKTFFSNLNTFFSEVMYGVKDSFKRVVEDLDEIWKNNPLNKYFGAHELYSLGEGLSKFVQSFENTFKALADNYKKFVSEFNIVNFITKIIEVAASLKLIDVITSMTKLMDQFKKLGETFKKSVDDAQGILNKLGDAISSFTDKVNKSTKAIQIRTLIMFAGAILMLSIALTELSKLDFQSLLTGLSGLIATIGTMLGTMKLISMVVSGMSTAQISKIAAISSAMMGFGNALITFTTAVKMLGELDWDELARGLVGVVTLIASITASAKILGSKNGTVMKGAVSLIGFALAIKILSTAVKPLGEQSWESLGKGMTAITGLCLELALTMEHIGKRSKGMLKGAVALNLASLALVELIYPMKQFGGMEWSSIAKGLVTIGGSLIILSTALKSLGKGASLKGTAALNGAVIALNLLIPPIKSFSTLRLDQVTIALVTLGGALAEMVVGIKMLSDTSALRGVSCMILMAGAIDLITPPLLAFGSMDLKSVARSLTMLGGALAEMVVGVKLLGGESAFRGVACMTLMAGAIDLLTPPLLIFSKMDWEGVAKSLIVLGGALTELTIAMNFMNGSLRSAAALLVVASAIDVLSVGLKILGSMSWAEVLVGLTALGGALATLGLAAKLMGPLNGLLISMAISLAAVGSAGIVFGMGLSFLADGLSKMSNVTTKAFGTMLQTFIDSAKSLFEIGKLALEGFCRLLIDGAPLIAEALYSLAKSTLAMVVKLVPEIADGIATLIENVLKSIEEHIPAIADSFMNIIVTILEAIASHIGPIVAAVKKIVINIFDLAFGEINVDDILKLSGVVAIITGFLYAMSGVTAILPSAMLGVLGFGAFVTEFMGILALIGLIANSTNAAWLINEAADVFEAIGSAIGRFVGGIAGGLAKGVTSQLPGIGNDLSAFMDNSRAFFSGMQGVDLSCLDVISKLMGVISTIRVPRMMGSQSLEDFGIEVTNFGRAIMSFSESVKGLDTGAVENAAKAAGVISELQNGLPKRGGVVQWFTGQQDFEGFSKTLPLLGSGIKSFGDSVKGLEPSTVNGAVNAAKSINELYSGLPKIGGVKQFFTGFQSLTEFAKGIVPLGKSIKDFSDSAKGTDTNVVTNAVAAAETISAFSNNLPKHGGVISLWSGDNTLAAFARELKSFGPSIKEYSDSVQGVDTRLVNTSIEAAKTISVFSENLPKHGGIVSLWSGDNTLSSFARELAYFGPSIKKYSDSVNGVDPDVVSISVNAAKSISAFSENLPKHGGLKSIWDGDNTLSGFANDLSKFGPAFRVYAKSVEGIDPDVVINSASAAKAIGEFAAEAPKFGGLKALIDGDVNLGALGEQIAAFGPLLKEFSDSVSGLSTDAVTNASSAAKMINEFSENAPDFGGMKSWWNGEIDLGRLGEQLSAFGPGLKKFADSTAGLDVKVIQNASSAGGAIVEFAKAIPATGGLSTLWSGEVDLGVFGEQIAIFGPCLMEFAKSVEGLDTAVVENAGKASQTISAFAKEVPSYGGVLGWFNGDNTLATFGEQISSFGPSLKKFAESVTGLDGDVVQNAANAAKSISEFAKEAPNYGGITEWFTGSNSLTEFGLQLESFGPHFKAFTDSVAGINVDVVANSTSVATSLANFFRELPETGGVKGWWSGDQNLASLGTQLEAFGNCFSNYASSMVEVDFALVNTSFETLNKFMDIANLVQTMEVTQIGQFGIELEKLGKTGIDGFIKAFSGEGYDRATKAGGEMIVRLRDGMQSKLNIIDEKMKNAYDNAINVFDSYKQKFINKGREVMQAFADGMNQNGSSKFKESVSSAMNDTLYTIDGFYDSFYTAGSNLIIGLSNGMSGYAYYANQTAASIGSGVLRSMAIALYEKSPSKATEEMGIYLDEGLAIGVKKGAGIAVREARNISANILSTFKNRLGDMKGMNLGISSAIKSEIIESTNHMSPMVNKVSEIIRISKERSNKADLIDTNPVITPVLDLSKLEDQSGRLDDILGSRRTYSFASSLSSVSGRSSTSQHIEVTSNNADVVRELKELRRETTELKQSMSNLRVVMDTGATVGALVDPIDKALGQKTKLKGRRV